MRISRIWGSALVALCQAVAQGAFEPRCANASGAALGGSFLFPHREPVKGRSHLNVTVSPGLFALPELSFVAFEVGCRWEDVEIGLGGSRFGSSLYGESGLTISGSCPLTPRSGFRAALSLHRLRIEGYGEGSAGSLSIQGEVLPIDGLTFRLALVNILRGKIGGEMLPAWGGGGIIWRPVPGLAFVAELRLETDQQTAATCGLEWKPVEGIAVRCGSSSDHPGLDAGGGIRSGRFSLDYAFRWHRELGGTHLITLGVDDLF